ncbi:MAG: ParA family protein [Bacteroidales bacterium]|nr:ParA family protein [Candidatus Cacconaster scatequi]
MEVVSFFSAKGGTGKTTFNLLFASYLSYICKKRVLMLDFDGPEYNALLTRKRELAVNKDVDEKELYPLEMVNDRSINSVNSLAKRLDALKEHIDYVIMDFGGSFEPTDAVCQMAKAKVLDTVVIPVEMDGMAISSAKSLAKVFQSFGQRTILFFNKVHGKEKPELYEALDEWFAKNDLNISKNRVKMAISLKRDSDSDGMFLRSSICFPKKDIKAINPAIINLFDEVVGYEGQEQRQDAKSGD